MTLPEVDKALDSKPAEGAQLSGRRRLEVGQMDTRHDDALYHLLSVFHFSHLQQQLPTDQTV
ncbi:hypothetical protein [Burkholderia sp. PU8-34]